MFIVVIIVMIIVVTLHRLHVGLGEDRADQGFMQIGRGVKRMLHDIYFCWLPIQLPRQSNQLAVLSPERR